MQKLNAAELLDQLILIKQEEHDQQLRELKNHFHETYESLRPINILKNSLKESSSSLNLKTQIADTAIGVTSGFLAKKLFSGNSSNPLVNLVGTMIGAFVASKAEKNAEGIKSIGSFLINKLVDNDHSK